MKKIACVILLLVMCCTLCACDPNEYQPLKKHWIKL